MFKQNRAIRLTVIFFALFGLILLFIFQRIDYSLLFFSEPKPQLSFIINRCIRFILNDNLVLLLIYGLFHQKKYVKFGLLVEVFGFVFLLIPYFLLRFGTEIDHMQLSFLHRIIVNPTLMLLLIPAIYLQQGKQMS